MILTLTNKTTYLLNESESQQVMRAMDAGARYIELQGDVIMLNAVIGIQSEERMDEVEHRKNHDYKCSHGRWHGRDDKCFGHDAVLADKTNTEHTPLLKYSNRDESEAYRAARKAAESIGDTIKRGSIRGLK